MKKFFIPLISASLLVFVFTQVSFSGPRPDYPTASAAGRSSLLRAFPGNFTKPNPGGAASLTNYTSKMPAARLDSSFVSQTPYPTNKWYTSLFTNPVDVSNTTQSKFGNRFAVSPMVAVYSSRFPYVWDEGDGWSDGGGYGYSLGGQSIKVDAQGYVHVSNALAFAVQGAKTGTNTDSNANIIHGSSLTVKSYSDWAVTAVLQDETDPSKRMTTTFGRGFVFTYNTFSPGVNPRLRAKYVSADGDVTYYYDNNGTMTDAGNNVTITTDHMMMRVRINKTDTNSGYALGAVVNEYQYFGIYAPQGTTFTISPYNSSYRAYLNITFPAAAAAEEDRYLSIALLKSPSTQDDTGAFQLFRDYYAYAYNFVTDTQVSWDYDQSRSEVTANYNFTFDAKRTGGGFIANQTVFAMYPHHWKNLVGTPNRSNTYNSIRGLLKVSAGSSFSTKHNFNGIVPFLSYEVPQGTESAKLQSYIDYDETFEPSQARIENAWKGNSNTYYHGKAVARAANLIPVFHQHGDFAARDAMVNKLKTELATWYSGSSSIKNFGYDAAWGGVIGSNPGGTVNDFGASQFNDHHFHYGYFIYASAILAIYDPEFASSSQYKGMVDLLVKEIYNPVRNDPSFPFLRNFDVYEGHSYANGRGGGDFFYGNDEESTSEAMNSWAAVYLWGLATGNQDWIDLAVYGYTTQYEATRNYYFNIDGDIWPRSSFNHSSVGMLFDSTYRWSLWWTPIITQTVMGIQVLPLTPSLLYMGYDTDYAEQFYNEMWNNKDTSGERSKLWRDIWLRYESLFNAPQALADWDSANLSANFPDTFNTGIGDDGSSMSFSYHFIHFFNAKGTVDTGYYASDPSFLVTNKDGERTFFAYNADKQHSKTVNFYKRDQSQAAPRARALAASVPDVPNVGSVTLAPGTMAQTKDFVDFEYTYTDMDYTANYSSNTERDVYSIFSDNFIGAVLGGNNYQDNLALDSWDGTITHNTIESFSDSYEGNRYLSAARNNSLDWGGWAFSFAGGAVDMSSYLNGKIEVSIKLASASPAAGDFEIGFKAIEEIWFKLSDLGFNPSLTSWQTVSIPLNASSSQLITDVSLGYVTLPFMMRHNSENFQSGLDVAVHIDSVLWKKAEILSPFSAVLKSRADNMAAEKIGWTESDFKRKNAVAQQYIEVGLNNAEGNSWCIQIYTDNKSSVTLTDALYSGNIDSGTVSGLARSGNTGSAMLPMMWRVASEIFDLNVSSETLVNTGEAYGMMVWGPMRDVSAFSNEPGSGLGNGSEQVIVWDRQGFKWDQWGMQRGVPPDDKKVRIYFLADFTGATRALYKANIVVEYFNE
ncbi:MAG: hypothetical protein LBR69_01680 [Endomicrobium sp.]|nr:hypothetical protein [Endomicrobium sp.]